MKILYFYSQNIGSKIVLFSVVNVYFIPYLKPKVWIITDRKIIDNVVHYGVKNRVKPVPIYDFEDFQPIFEFEMEQAQKDEGKFLVTVRGSPV